MSPAFHVDARGITVPRAPSGPEAEPLNVLFDGQRVWSFDAGRDGVEHHDKLVVPWPKVLEPYLVGNARVTLEQVGSGAAIFDDEVRFDGSGRRLVLTDDQGRPLSVDKGGRLQRTFANTDQTVKALMATKAAELIADLHEVCGLEAYVTYGSLLGAVRTGHMIGHDSDVDVGYLSSHTHPFDIIRECRATQRAMAARGWRVVRMSSANFKAWIRLDEESRIGLDVFPSFHIGDAFHVMATKRGTLDRERVVPLGSVVLEGVELPAPHDPEAFLAYLYGEDWRIPNPAFKFGHPALNVARMSAWFRPSRRGLRYWSDFFASPQGKARGFPSSSFATWVHRQLPREARVLDLGCGSGGDAVWLAEQGHAVTGYDFSRDAVRRTRELAAERGTTLTARMLNLQDTKDTLTAAARIAHRGVVHDITARRLAEVLSPEGRALLWRFSSMTQRRGGRTYLEFRVRLRLDRLASASLDPAVARSEIERAGGLVVSERREREHGAEGVLGREVCRMVIRWDA